MSYQSDIIRRLTNDTSITDLVGTRIYADLADGTDPAPFIVYSIPTTRGETPHDGIRDLEFPLVQFSCYAATKAEAVQIAGRIRRSVEGKTLGGFSNLSLIFDDQHGTRDAETNLFAEIIEFRGACNPN